MPMIERIWMSNSGQPARSVNFFMAKSRIAPIQPGVYLKEILDGLGLSQYRLALELGSLPCGSAMWCVGNIP